MNGKKRKKFLHEVRIQPLPQGFPKSKCLLRNDFTPKSFDCNKENRPKCLNFLNVLIHSQCNLSILNIHQNT